MDDPLKAMYQDLGEIFEEKLLMVASKYINSSSEIPEYSYTASNGLESILPEGDSLSLHYVTPNTYSVLVGMNTNNLNNWKKAYITDKLHSKVLMVSQANNDEAGNYPQYHKRDGLIYFKDWNGNHRLCVPDALRVTVMSEVHNILTKSAHGGHAKMYNRIALIYYWHKMS
jgi:hypothetical protein